MELAKFAPVMQQIGASKTIDIGVSGDAAFSLPVAVRRGVAQYDAMFLYRRPAEGKDTAPRPFGWVLFDAAAGTVAQMCRCDIVDFMPPGAYPPGTEIPMVKPQRGGEKKAAVLRDKLLAAYEEIRAFAFEENLTRQQASTVSTYKDLFEKLSYPAHYPFYHALSPAFFHWLRMPLPKEALMEGTKVSELQRDGYQLLILENLQQLVRQFQEKIAVDHHKEALYDEMHRELQGYKNDLLGSLTLAMERDVIQIIDDVAKSVGLFREEAVSEENFRRLYTLLAGVETDLCDLLYRHGVEPYTLDEVDVTRQKIISTVATDTAAKDKQIALRHGSGWEKDGKIIRPERISVYVYREE